MTDRRLFWLAIALTVAVCVGMFCYTPGAHGQALPTPAAKAPPKGVPAVKVEAVVTAPQAHTAGGCGVMRGGLASRAVVRVRVFAETRPVRGLFWRLRVRLGGCG